MSQEKPPPYSPAAPYNYSGVPHHNPQAGVPIGFQPPPAPPQHVQYVQGSGQSVVYAHTVPQQTVAVAILPNTCPACRTGVVTDNFTCCGIAMAIIFFPIGLLCCMLMTQKQCSYCGSNFG